MSESPPDSRMPNTARIVAEVVDDQQRGSRRRVDQLDRDTLIDVATVLLSPGVEVKDALAIVREEHDSAVVSRSGFYAWAADFREAFAKRLRRYRERMVLPVLPAGDDTGEAVRGIKARLLRMAAEEVARAGDLDDLGESSLPETLRMVESISRDESRRRDLDLKAADLERRLADSTRAAETGRVRADKLAAETALLRQRHAQLPGRLKALQTDFDRMAGRLRRGETVNDKAVASFADALAAMQAEAKAAADSEDAA